MAGTRGVFHVLVKNTDEFRTVVSFYMYVCVCTKLLQSCPTLCNTMDDSPSGSSVHEILQQEYWSGLPCSPPGNLSYWGIKIVSLISPGLAGRYDDPVIYIICEHSISDKWQVLPVILFFFPLSDKNVLKRCPCFCLDSEWDNMSK